MKRNERQRFDALEVAKDALTGYAVIVLGLVLFIISLVAISIVVRLIVGASAGV